MYPVGGAAGSDQHHVRQRQLGQVALLVTLRSRMINLENLHTRQPGHAPGAPVVTGAENGDLRRATGDRVTDRRVDCRGRARRNELSG